MILRQSNKLAAACAREARLALDPHVKAWFLLMGKRWRRLAKLDGSGAAPARRRKGTGGPTA
jgi:hypothetical protein